MGRLRLGLLEKFGIEPFPILINSKLKLKLSLVVSLYMLVTWSTKTEELPHIATCPACNDWSIIITDYRLTDLLTLATTLISFSSIFIKYWEQAWAELCQPQDKLCDSFTPSLIYWLLKQAFIQYPNIRSIAQSIRCALKLGSNSWFSLGFF